MTTLPGYSFQQVKTYVGPACQLVVDMSNWALVLQDGVTPGGVRFETLESIKDKFQPKDAELTAIAALDANATGMLIRVQEGVYAFRKLEVEAPLAISQADGTQGNPKITFGTTITQQMTFKEDVTFEKRVTAQKFVGAHEGDLTGNVTGNVTGGLDATGKTVQVDDGAFSVSKIAGLSGLVNQLITAALGGLVDQTVPIGSILMWGGSFNNIPEGWALCDGSNGTPNLTDKFIRSAPSADKHHVTGGTTQHTHVSTAAAGGVHSHTITVADTTLEVMHLPAHTHNNGVVDKNNTLFNHGVVGADPSRSQSIDNNSSAGIYEGVTSETGGGQPHAHGASSADAGSHTHAIEVAAQDHIPPFYSIAFIMKIA